MFGRTVLSGLLVALVLGVPAWAGASVIFSDSFEEPENTQNWEVYQDFGDWDATEGAGIEVQTNGTISFIEAYHGEQYVELDSDTDRGGSAEASTNSSMTRKINLTAGRYEVIFQYFPRTDTEGDNAMNVYLDGASEELETNLIGSRSAVKSDWADWRESRFRFDVDGTDNLYALTFAAGGEANELGGFVDQVRLVRVPAPASLALLGAGLLGLGLASRQRRR